MTAATDQDVVDLLTTDHREVEKIFGELEALGGSTDPDSVARKKALAEQATIELVKHSVAEEARVYPKLAEKVSPQEADQLRHEQAEAEKTMKKLEQLDAGSPEFDSALTTLMREIREHVAEEEQQAFPKMREAFSHDELITMAEQVKSVKKIAPTRPHPTAPDTPPGNLLLGPVAGLFDRLRDAIGNRGTDS